MFKTIKTFLKNILEKISYVPPMKPSYVTYHKDGSVSVDIVEYWKSDEGKKQLADCDKFWELYKTGKIQIFD